MKLARLLVVIIATIVACQGSRISHAQDSPATLTVMCRCQEGGVNSNLYTWLRTYVVPTYEETLAEEGIDVTVTLREFSGGDEELHDAYAVQLGMSDGADLMAFDGFWIPEFYADGLLKPLAEIVGPEVENWSGWDHIPDPVEQLMMYNGMRFGIPNGTDVRVIFYRTDLFEQAGIPVPWQPTSWDDILDAARQLKAAGVPVPIQLNAGTAMGEATTMQGYFMALLGAGEHMYDFDQQKWIVSSPGILDTLNLYRTIYLDEALGDAAMQLAADGREQSFVRFGDGEIGSLVEGDFFWRSVLFREMGVEDRGRFVRWVPMPAREPGLGYRGQDFVSISGGGGWILNPNTAHPHLAWRLITHMADVDAVRAFQLTQPRISFRDDVQTAGDTIMSDMADAMLDLSTVRPQLPEYPPLSVEAQRMTERVITGEMTPEEAMAAYAEAAIALVGEENTISIPLEEP
jgi:multiple sugar transport system substrate-binding protein